MSKQNTFETDLLSLILNAVAIANIADNAATSPLTNLFISFVETVSRVMRPGYHLPVAQSFVNDTIAGAIKRLVYSVVTTAGPVI